MQKVSFITSNLAKFEQLTRHIDYPIIHLNIDLSEIQSLDVEEVINHKARQAYACVGEIVLVEDTSLVFNALGKLPGPLIKWFMHELGNEGLCRLLDRFDDRTAVAEVCFGLYDGNKLKTFNRRISGTIAKNPRGKSGFGWDPIFIPEGFSTTWAEMLDREHQNIRKPLVEQLEKHLKKNGK